MPVARDDLRRDRLRLEGEPLARDPLELRVGDRVRPDRARQLSVAHRLERAAQALATALELEHPAGELEPEGRRLRVDAVRAPDAERLPMLLGPGHDRCLSSCNALEQEHAGVAELKREPGVHDVGGGEPVVQPAPLLAEPLLDGAFGRISDVIAGTDSALYLCTSNVGTATASADDDRLLRVRAIKL